MKRKAISVFLVLCIIVAASSNVYAMPSEVTAPNWHGTRTVTSTWDCIPLNIQVAKDDLAKLERHIEKVSVALGFLSLGGKWYPEIPISGTISTAVLVREKHNIEDIIAKMEDCYINHRGIKYTTTFRGNDKSNHTEYRWIGTF